MKVFKIVTNDGSEWNGDHFAKEGRIYYVEGRATKVLTDDTGKCFSFSKRFRKVWIQEYELTPVEDPALEPNACVCFDDAGNPLNQCNECPR